MNPYNTAVAYKPNPPLRELRSEYTANLELARGARPDMDAAVFPAIDGPADEPFADMALWNH
jgi:hypothetical protein